MIANIVQWGFHFSYKQYSQIATHILNLFTITSGTFFEIMMVMVFLFFSIFWFKNQGNVSDGNSSPLIIKIIWHFRLISLFDLCETQLIMPITHYNNSMHKQLKIQTRRSKLCSIGFSTTDHSPVRRQFLYWQKFKYFCINFSSVIASTVWLIAMQNVMRYLSAKELCEASAIHHIAIFWH